MFLRLLPNGQTRNKCGCKSPSIRTQTRAFQPLSEVPRVRGEEPIGRVRDVRGSPARPLSSSPAFRVAVISVHDVARREPRAAVRSRSDRVSSAGGSRVVSRPSADAPRDHADEAERPDRPREFGCGNSWTNGPNGRCEGEVSNPKGLSPWLLARRLRDCPNVCALHTSPHSSISSRSSAVRVGRTSMSVRALRRQFAAHQPQQS